MFRSANYVFFVNFEDFETAIDETIAEASESRFGELVAPQSFAVCTDDSHGAAPASQGRGTRGRRVPERDSA